MLKQMAGLALRFLLFLATLAAIGGVVLWVNWDTGAVAYYRADYAVAMKAYKPLAEKGCVDAQYLVGTMYETDEGGVPQDYSAAAKWYLLAAEGGDGNAQSKIGEMYRKGWGVPQSDVEEKKWRDRSAAQGFTQSRRLYPKCDSAPGS